MSSKLTLSIRAQVIEEAKEYARNHGKSLSSIVEEYLKSLSSKSSSGKTESFSDIVNELKGSIKTPKDFKSYKETLEEALVDKYLK